MTHSWADVFDEKLPLNHKLMPRTKIQRLESGSAVINRRNMLECPHGGKLRTPPGEAPNITTKNDH